MGKNRSREEKFKKFKKGDFDNNPVNSDVDKAILSSAIKASEIKEINKIFKELQKAGDLAFEESEKNVTLNGKTILSKEDISFLQSKSVSVEDIVEYIIDASKHKYVNVLCIDSGSGSIKLKGARINKDTGKVASFDGFGIDKQIAIGLSKDIESDQNIKEIMATGIIHDAYNEEGKPLDMCEIFNTIESNNPEEMHVYKNKTSNEIREKYINSLIDVVSQMYEFDQEMPIEIWLVGTAALRKADDGERLVDALEDEMKDRLKEANINTNFKIITQEDEGLYAFRGAEYKAKFDPSEAIVWDIGGGSMQISGRETAETEEMKVLKGTLASITFHGKLADKNIASFPMSKDNIDDAINLAKQELKLADGQNDWVNNKTIYGVGNIHGAILDNLRKHKIINENDTTYTAKNLRDLIEIFQDLNDEEVKEKVVDAKFYEVTPTNFILVLAAMEKYDVEYVEVLRVSNTDAMLQMASTTKPNDDNVETHDTSSSDNIHENADNNFADFNNSSFESPGTSKGKFTNFSGDEFSHANYSNIYFSPEISFLGGNETSVENKTDEHNNDSADTADFEEAIVISQLTEISGFLNKKSSDGDEEGDTEDNTGDDDFSSGGDNNIADDGAGECEFPLHDDELDQHDGQ